MTHTARDGWKLVPVEPTPEMLFSAKESVKDWSEFGAEWLEEEGAAWTSAYRAMLEAAPSPPSEVTREEINKVLHDEIRSCTGISLSQDGTLKLADAVLSLFHQRGEKG